MGGIFLVSEFQVSTSFLLLIESAFFKFLKETSRPNYYRALYGVKSSSYIFGMLP
ncbi:hypothetical protein JHK87_056952 [Glycine soja]|nr:hypothetical protein JHK87_056952 [Glycine soja]